jgi:hypothetical protein
VPDKKSRGVSNLANSIPDVPDAPTVSAVNVGTARAYNNGAATVSISSPTGGRPASYSITTSPSTVTTTATSSPVTLTGLSSATSYTTTVTPTNVSATGAATTSAAFTATTVPQAPTIGTFTDGGTGTTGTLSFTAGATGGSSITGYTYSTDGTNYSAASGTTSPFSLTGLTAGTYTFYLKATNANGTSLASTGVSGTVITPNSYESIASSTPSGTNTVTFSSIASSYASLQLRIFHLEPTNGGLRIRFNSDAGLNYTYHELQGDGSAASATGAATGSYSGFAYSWVTTSTTAPHAGIIDVLDYASTTKYKTIRGINGQDTNASGAIILASTLWLSTSAVNSITILSTAGNYGSGTTFALYGIKG